MAEALLMDFFSGKGSVTIVGSMLGVAKVRNQKWQAQTDAHSSPEAM
jgi:hypothetical protein